MQYRSLPGGGRELKAADYLAKNGVLEKPVGPDFLG